MTVLFTDIRGFTAYSETVAPETVVEMLNRLLQAQADVVEKHGGDIDKFVGDEIMAVFQGHEAEARALRCGLDMIDAVVSARREGESLAIGVGIANGEMIYGPIGSHRRMDFTVIGDVVNTGARLCSAAAPGQVIASASIRHEAGDLTDISFEDVEPLKLKGKREPFAVYRVTRKTC